MMMMMIIVLNYGVVLPKNVSKFNNFFSLMVQLRCVHVVGVQAVARRKKRENLNTVLLLNISSSSSLAASNKTTTNCRLPE
jgi:hypothetical protein